MSSLARCLRRSFCTAEQPRGPVKSLSTQLYKEQNFKRLVENFKKSCESYRFRTKTGIYDVTVRRLASAKKFELIEEILEDQKKYRDISREGFAVRIIHLYGKSGMFENAQKMFDEMPERNCKRTVLSFNALLDACVNSKKFDKVVDIFRGLPGKLSIQPDLISYNTVAKAFCDMGSLDSAVSMLDEMENKGLEPDLITFNTLLYGSYVKGHFEEGETIWSIMMEKKVVPDIRSYNARLFGLATACRSKDAVDLFEEMKVAGVEPDIYSFNALIKGFVNEGELEEAKRWYSEIEKGQEAPNKVTFAVLIPFLCQNGDYEFAFKVCKQVFRERCIIDKSILQHAVDGLARESKIKEAEELVQLGKRNAYLRYKLTLPSVK